MKILIVSKMIVMDAFLYGSFMLMAGTKLATLGVGLVCLECERWPFCSVSGDFSAAISPMPS